MPGQSPALRRPGAHPGFELGCVSTWRYVEADRQRKRVCPFMSLCLSRTVTHSESLTLNHSLAHSLTHSLSLSLAIPPSLCLPRYISCICIRVFVPLRIHAIGQGSAVMQHVSMNSWSGTETNLGASTLVVIVVLELTE